MPPSDLPRGHPVQVRKPPMLSQNRTALKFTTSDSHTVSPSIFERIQDMKRKGTLHRKDI